MNVRVFCEGGPKERPPHFAITAIRAPEEIGPEYAHPRTRCERDYPLGGWYCPACSWRVTDGVVEWSVPKPYREALGSGVGHFLMSLADIGAIDLIWGGTRWRDGARVEYPRERDVIGS